MGWFPEVRRRFVALGVGASGLVSMSLEVALLPTFQTLYGYVDHMAGGIIGAFMVGIAAGSLGAARRLRGRGHRAAARSRSLALGVMATTALALGAPPPALSATELRDAAPVLFALLNALVGAIVGVTFPLASSDAAGGDNPTRAPAGLCAADLAGAAHGAAAVGAFLAPVLGLPRTCFLGALIAGAAALLAAVRAIITR